MLLYWHWEHAAEKLLIPGDDIYSSKLRTKYQSWCIKVKSVKKTEDFQASTLKHLPKRGAKNKAHIVNVLQKRS